ncbi:MAG: HAMP domain-containing sensor histidine kinase [Pseudomonadota bacterium]
MLDIRNRLYFRQAVRVTAVALMLGLFFSMVEIAIDFRSERNAIRSTVQQVLSSLQTPATQAAFTLSKYQADGVTDSLLKYEVIHSAAVLTETGVVLASQSRARAASRFAWLSDGFVEGTGEYSQPLYAQGGSKWVGSVTVRVDSAPVAASFLNRAGRTLLFGLMTNLALALAVSVVFYYTLSRPLQRLSTALATTDARRTQTALRIESTDYLDAELSDLLASANRFLEHQVVVRTEDLQAQNTSLRLAEQKLQTANDELTNTLAALHRAQEELVRSEKLAALGALVAGVAHELNTPIGNSLTVASTLEYHTRAITSSFASGAGFKRSVLENYLTDASNAVDILVRSLHRAADLITSFKQVAVDQTSSQRRSFDLAELVEEIVKTLSPTLKKTAFTVQLELPQVVMMDSFPGPLGQVLINLVNNAVIHGFDGGASGTVTVGVQAVGPDSAQLIVKDDGVGIAPENLKRIYDPFFTTKMGAGGSGLGLHITHNIVESVLGGRIDVHSEVGSGTTFTLSLPLVAPHTASTG